ncbi:hypothetical protein [Christensenella minuta]|uniref:hypothetical protein n=1 Tax=Christensenella minuta TaxID=626937 RepID=UPI002157C1D2|nr:hypothetical protein [Christensenella minuta]
MREEDRYIEFLNAAVAVCKGFDNAYEFECPICGGRAWVLQSSCNEHHKAACEGCGAEFTE